MSPWLEMMKVPLEIPTETLPGLQQDCESRNETANQDTCTIDVANVNSRATQRPTGRLFSLQDTRHRSASHCSGSRGHVDTLGLLSSTRVIGTASILAGRVGTLFDTLGVGLRADVVCHGLRVLRGIRRGVVAADALVGEGLLPRSAESLENTAAWITHR